MISLRRIASSSTLRATDVAVSMLATLWITPLLVHTLGRERYGLWVMVLTLVSYLDIFDLGLTSAVTRYVSRALGRNDMAAARETVRSAFTILAVIGAGCLVLVAALALIAPWLVRDAAQASSLRLLIVILGTTIALNFPMRVFTGVLEAFVRYEFTTAASVGRTLVTTAALWWSLGSGGGLMQVVIIVAAGQVLFRMLQYFFAREVLPQMRLLPLGTHSVARRELLDYGGKNFLMKLVDLIRFRIDTVVIARFVGLAPVGVYSVGMSLIRYYREIIEALGGVLMPVFSRAEGAGDRERIRTQFVAALRVCGAIATFIGGSIALYGGYFIERWLGPDFRDSYYVALVLVGPFILALAQNPGVFLLYGLSKQERLLRLSAIEGVLNLTLSLVLVLKWGIFGVAAGTSLALLFSKMVLQPRIVCEEAGLSLRRYYLHAVLFPVAITAAPMLACHALLAPWLRPEYPRILLAVIVQGLAVAPIAWSLLLGKTGRERLSELLFRKPAGAAR